MALNIIKDTRFINESVSEVKLYDWLKSEDTDNFINKDHTLNKILVTFLFNLNKKLDTPSKMITALKTFSTDTFIKTLVDCNNNVYYHHDSWRIDRLYLSTLETIDIIDYDDLHIGECEGVIYVELFPIDIKDNKLILKK